MTGKLPNLIAAEDLKDYNAWSLPDVGTGAKVLAAQQLKRQQLAAQLRAEAELQLQREIQTEQAAAPQDGEIIEDVIDDGRAYSPLTAEQLQEMSEAAEKEGFDQGYGEGVVQGIAEGKKQGYEDGLAQAQAEARETLSTQVSQLLQIAEALVDPIGEQQAQLQALMLSYVTTLTEQVIERELRADPVHIQSVIERAFAALPVGAEKIKVVLNPADLALVEQYAAEQDPSWLFVGDPQLQAGGCRVESAESLINYSVEARVQALFAQFLDQQLVVAGNVDAEEVLAKEVATEEVSEKERDTKEQFVADSGDKVSS
jgi:flagellar assembly protein FliH